jgi:hypothetical protein
MRSRKKTTEENESEELSSSCTLSYLSLVSKKNEAKVYNCRKVNEKSMKNRID